MMRVLKQALGLPEVRGVPLDSPTMIAVHRGIILRKGFLRKLYEDYYQMFVMRVNALIPIQGKVLELGSGGGFLQRIFPEVVTSDVCTAPGIDQVISANRLPFREHELKAIFLLNVLHHLSNPEGFFREAERCLMPRGRVVLIEPFNSLWGRILYKRFHHEPFDESAPGWEVEGPVLSGVEGGTPVGRLSYSNQALPWIIFWRDRPRFEAQFPSLKISSITLHTVICYALSGGLSWRPFVPAFTYPLFRAVDRVLSRYGRIFPTMQTIILEKQ